MDESLIDWIANEGARVSAIVADLKVAVGSNPRDPPVLDQLRRPCPAAVAKRPRCRLEPVLYGSELWLEQSGDATSLVVPIRVPMPVIKRQVVAVPVPRAAAAAPGAARSHPDRRGRGSASRTGMVMEAVHIDQTTLGSRPGYKVNFIGGGKLSVPLPKIPAALKSKVATLKGSSGQSELKYFNYSVVMNKERKLAFFSCVNIDGGKQQDVGKREGDSWLATRASTTISRSATSSIASNRPSRRTAPPTRSIAAIWSAVSTPPGAITVAEAKEHGDDSFHFTNCSPQFFSFNQGKQLWAGLEDYHPRRAAEGRGEGHRHERAGVRRA